MLLDKDINSIIYQSYIKLGDIAYELAQNAQCGLSTDAEERVLWEQAFIIDAVLDTIGDHIVIQNNSVYELRDITIQEMNKFLYVLKDKAGIYDFPVAPFLPVKDISQVSIGSTPGPPGANGVNAYSTIAFASDNVGTGLSSTNDGSLQYVSFKTSTTPIPFTQASFTGTWVKFVGANGNNGSGGTSGSNSFVYIRYATDNTGSGFSQTPDNAHKYIAFLQSSTDLGIPGSTLFTGLWVKFIGNDGASGTNGLNGNTIITGSSAPSGLQGRDGDYFIDNVANNIYGPKLLGTWPPAVSLVGPPGSAGTNGSNGSNGTNGTAGTNAYLYIAYADDVAGTNFTLTFDPSKQFIALFESNVLFTPTLANFTGLFTKYRGDGDKWATISATSLTIATGLQTLTVGLNLSYTTGQYTVIAENGNESNRMTGYCRSYNPATGQLLVNIDTTSGSGTFATWQVNLFGVPVQILTQASYYGEIYVESNSGGTPQTLSTSYTKVTQFVTNGDASAGVTVSNSTDNIQVAARGEYIISCNLAVSGSVGEYILQLFDNGVAMPGTETRYNLVASEKKSIMLMTCRALLASDIIDVRVKAASGTPSFLVEEGRLNLFSTGNINNPNFTTFTSSVGIGSTISDTFVASLGKSCYWDYTISQSTNQRTGKVSASWVGTSVTYDEFNVTSLGTTTDVTLSVGIVAGSVQLVSTSISNGWTVSGNRTILT